MLCCCDGCDADEVVVDVVDVVGIIYKIKTIISLKVLLNLTELHK